MLAHEYETIVIIRPDIEDAAVMSVAEMVESIVTDSGGHVLDREDWGKRKLSYPIKKDNHNHQRGHYLRLNYLCEAPLIAEIERKIRLGESTMRFMTVRLADAVDVPTRIEEAAVHRARREEEAKRRAEEAAMGLDDDDYDVDGDNNDDNDDDDDVGRNRARAARERAAATEENAAD
ncbi:MAG: 30S ribosomal protein S6 [Myxococcota bacterium]